MSPSRLYFSLAAACAFLLPVSVTVAQTFEVPPNDGFYTQTIDILTSEQEDRLETSLGAHTRETGQSIAILVIEAMTGTTLADAAKQTAARWRLETGSGNDVLIVASLSDHEEMILAGSGLSVSLPDEAIAGVLATDIRPRFSRGEYEEGLTEAVYAIQKHIKGEYTVRRYEPGGGNDFLHAVLAVFMVFLQYLAARVLWRRRVWAGAVSGGIFGLYLAVSYAWWLALPILVIVGVVFDGMMIAAAANPGRRVRGTGTIVEPEAYRRR